MHSGVQFELTARGSKLRDRFHERVVAAVNRAFPAVEYTTWAECERLLAQAQAAARLVETYDLVSEPAARLLCQSAWYLHERARYAEAEPLYKRALGIREDVLGSKHPDVASSLNYLANLHRAQGRYAEAEPLYQRALALREHVLGPEHPDIAQSLNNLAGLYYVQGHYAKAEPLYQRALALLEHVLEP
jgi:tetratricopeptide (TPR) repeat protein